MSFLSGKKNCSARLVTFFPGYKYIRGTFDITLYYIRTSFTHRFFIYMCIRKMQDRFRVNTPHLGGGGGSLESWNWIGAQRFLCDENVVVCMCAYMCPQLMYTLTRSPYSFSSSPSYVSSIWPNGHRPPKEGGTHKHKRKSLTKGNAITSRATELLSSLFFQGIEKSKETAHIELGGRGTSHFPLQSTRCATLFLVPFF